MRYFGAPLALALVASCKPVPAEKQPDAMPVANASAAADANPASTAAAEPKAVAGKTVDCSGQETTIFSCPMPGGKHLAVCAPQRGEAEYRFGDASPELTLTGGKWANTMYSGGGESQILFSNGDTDYIVFSRMVRTNFAEGEPNYPAITDGVVIMRGDTSILRLCEGGQAEKPIDHYAAEREFGEMEDIFTGDTIRADPEWARE